MSYSFFSLSLFFFFVLKCIFMKYSLDNNSTNDSTLANKKKDNLLDSNKRFITSVFFYDSIHIHIQTRIC